MYPLIIYFVGFAVFAFLTGKAIENYSYPLWEELLIIFLFALLWPGAVIGILIVGIVSMLWGEKD